jgi:chromosome segregation ATPase
MGSLYEKAQSLREQSAPVPADLGAQPALSGMADISFDEQIEIIAEINKAVEQRKIEIKPETFSFSARKRGSLAPLIINAAALFVLLAGAFFLVVFYNRQERSFTGRGAAVLTAESRIIAALREESQQQLSLKERQIEDIQERLSELRERSETLQRQTSSRIRERENELREQLAAEMEAERQKLRQQGLSGAAIDEQLDSLAQRLEAENRSRLEAFRQASEAELAEKQAELAASREQYDLSLSRFRQEREALEQQFSSREAELQSRLERQAAQAESARSAEVRITGQLEELQEQRRREQLVSDQILASYARVRDSLRSGGYEAALRDLGNLESYLDEASRSVPELQERLPVDRFIISSLRRLIETERSPASGPVPQAGRQVEEVEAADAGRAAEALASLQAELERSQEALRRQGGELEQTRSALERRAGELERARTTIGRQSEEIARLEAARSRLEEVRREVGSLRREYESLSASGAPAAVSQQKVLDLVDTKLQIREVLSSEDVQRQYPGLIDSMEEYFTTYGQVQRRAGGEQALEEAVALLDALLASRSVDPRVVRAEPSAPQPQLFARFLEKLEALLR